MTADEQALLAAVTAAPEDDTPRLVYADWLDETGSPEKAARAEFIRTHIALARMPDEDDGVASAERRVGLELRALELLRDGHREREWFAPAREPVGAAAGVKPSPFGGAFIRGFVNFALAEPEQFLRAGEAMFDAHPVHGLSCGVSVPPMDEARTAQFLSAPWLRRVRRIELNVAGAAAEQFFTTERLAGLEDLAIRDGGTAAPPGTPVPARPLGRLRSLSLAGTFTHGPGAARRLAELLPDCRPHRLTVDLRGGRGEALGEFLRLDQCRDLRRLTAFGWPAGPAGVEAVRALAGSACWHTLEALLVGGDGMDDAAVGLFAAARPTPSLRRLSLATHRMTARGLTALADSPVLRSVTALDVGGGSRIGDEGAALLARSPYLGNLAALGVPYSRLGPRGVKVLAEASWAGGLVRLDLRDNAVRKAGVQVLADPARYPRLRRLEFQRVVRTHDLKAVLKDRFGTGVRFEF